MARYIIKRVLLAIVTIWAVATLTFFLMNAVPGGPFLSEKAVSPEATAALEEKYGLDKPLVTRYFTYLGDAIHGDFGDSLKQRGRTVSEIIGSKFPTSAAIGGLAIVVSLTLGTLLGCIAAVNKGKVSDSIISVISTLGIAVPSFVFCTFILYLFGVKLKWLPTMGLTSAANYILPVIALSLYPTSSIMRLVRSSMLDVLGQDYIRTAKAKGLSKGSQLFKHALRNAILPVITILGPMIASILTGSFIIEKIFVIPGLGGEFINAIQGRDYTLIMGTTIFVATLLIVLNLVVDIVYKIVDPRITLE